MRAWLAAMLITVGAIFVAHCVKDDPGFWYTLLYLVPASACFYGATTILGGGK